MKLIRYSMVSVVGVVITQAMIFVLHRDIGLSDVWTNIVAVALSAIPAYYLNRAWVWGKRGKSHMTKEVIPFWAFAFAGLITSTLLVAVIAPDKAPGEAETMQDTLRVMAGNIGGFGILWVARFLVLDRLLFGAHHHTPFSEELEHEIDVIEHQ